MATRPCVCVSTEGSVTTQSASMRTSAPSSCPTGKFAGRNTQRVHTASRTRRQQSKARRPPPLQCQAPDTLQKCAGGADLEQQAPPSTAEQQAPPSTAEDSPPSNEARTAEEDNVFSTQAMPASDVQAAPQQVTASHSADASPAAAEPVQAVDMATPLAPAAMRPPRLFLDLFALMQCLAKA